MPWPDSSFYEQVALIRQIRPAMRLLQATLEEGGFSRWELARADGSVVELAVEEPKNWREEAGTPIRREIVAIPKGQGGKTVLALVDRIAGADRLAVELTADVLAVPRTEDGRDQVQDVIADLVVLAGLMTGGAPAQRVDRAEGAWEADALLNHAYNCASLMEHMTALATPADKARVVQQLLGSIASYHRLLERMCNEADPHERFWQEAQDWQGRIVAHLQLAGIDPSRVSFTSDPRGAPVRIDYDTSGTLYLLKAPQATARVLAAAPKAKVRKAAQPKKGVAAPAAAVEAPAAEPNLRERVVTPEVLEILRASRLEGDKLYLPAAMERKMYEQVNEVIEIAGGRWKGGKTRAHVLADGHAQQKFARMLATGQILDAKDFDFFWTPADEARELVRLAGVQPGMLVAEPSAGRGAIAKELAAVVGTGNVHTFELLPENARALRDLGLRVHEGDFLEQKAEPIYDAICMNPPFGGQADMRHVEHALRMLKPTGTLVAIVSPSFEFRGTKQAEAFRELLSMAGERVRDLPAGTFLEAGTDVRTVILRFDAQRLPWNLGLQVRQAVQPTEQVGLFEEDDEPAQMRMRA